MSSLRVAIEWLDRTGREIGGHEGLNANSGVGPENYTQILTSVINILSDIDHG